MLDKRMSYVLKGIGVIFMVIHHFFTFPNWYIASISYPGLHEFARFFCSPFKLCVGIYAFITGYGYFYVKEKSLKYSAKKIYGLLIKYWAVYIPLLIIALVLGCYNGSLGQVVLELFAIRRPIMFFCWYVYFYIIAMFLLYLETKTTRNNLIGNIILGLIVVNIVCGLIISGSSNKEIIRILSDVRTYFQVVMVGYLLAQINLFSKVKRIVVNVRGVIKVTIAIVTAVGSVLLRHYLAYSFLHLGHIGRVPINIYINYDVLYVPIFVFSVVAVLHNIREHFPVKVLKKLGEYSVYMWFWHCIFFNTCKEYTQPLLYISKYPIVVLMWGLTICFVLTYLTDKVLKMQNQKIFMAKKQNRRLYN